MAERQGSAEEIPSDEELKTAEELNVGLPANNAFFRSLAEEIAQKLPQELAMPLPEMRKQLKETLRWEDRQVEAEQSGEKIEIGDITVDRYVLSDGEWKFPGVVVTPKNFQETVFVVADSGYAAQAERIAKLAAEGQRVVCFDPALMGETNPPDALYKNAQLMATVGARPLGIQASQILAAIQLASGHLSVSDVKLVTIGPRSSLAALCATAVDGKQLIAEVETEDLPETLKAFFREGRKYDRTPEVYCFGLLEHFDVPQLRKMHALAK